MIFVFSSIWNTSAVFGIRGDLEGLAAPEAFRATIGRSEKGRN
jgi:hypothetical protein